MKKEYITPCSSWQETSLNADLLMGASIGRHTDESFTRHKVLSGWNYGCYVPKDVNLWEDDEEE